MQYLTRKHTLKHTNDQYIFKTHADTLLLPVLPHEGLEAVNVDAHAVGTAAAVTRAAALPYPAVDGEVRGLSEVEAVVEASVVSSGEGDHELSGLLRNAKESKTRTLLR